MSSKLGAVLLLAAVALAARSLAPRQGDPAQALLARAWGAAESGDAAPPLALGRHLAGGPARGAAAGDRGDRPGRRLGPRPGLRSGTRGRTPLPGEPGNAILAGHRDTTFRFLERLVPGDEIRTKLPDGRESFFRVDSTRVQDAADPWAFDAPDGATTLTLATCWPFDSPVPGGRLRYVVRAVVSGDPSAALRPR